jgi:uncharacterized protein DUF1501
MGIGMSAGAAIAAKFGLSLHPAVAAAAAKAGGQDTTMAGKAKRCILLWMMGAPSQMDTWDPKPGTETGGPFSAIETSAPGIQIAEHLPLVAKQMKHLSLIRTVNSRDPNHETAAYLLHTAYRKAADIEHPHMGSIVAQELGMETDELPPVVVIGSGSPAGTGYLAPEWAPMVFDKLSAPAEDVLASQYNPRERLNRRWRMLQSFEYDFAQDHEDKRIAARRLASEKAYKILTSDRVKAFDVKQEPESGRALYGKTDFGQACLMARRLVESGVRFVEVMYGDWDTHVDNFDRVKQLSTDIDKPMAALVEDLDRRGMLKDTLVLWMGEFGRTPKINASKGRDHWTTWSVAMGGGGIQPGRVIGKTDPLGMSIVDRPVPVNNLFATIYHACGIPADKKLIQVPRPMKVVDGGQPVKELF